MERHINNKKNVYFYLLLYLHIFVSSESPIEFECSGPCPLRGLLFRNSILVCLSLVDVSVGVL